MRRRSVSSDELLKQLEWRRKAAKVEADRLRDNYPVEAAGLAVVALLLGREIRRRKTLRARAQVAAHLRKKKSAR